MKIPTDEELVARIFIEPSFTGGLSDYITGKLYEILEKQFEEGTSAEVGGSIFHRNKSLELQIVKSQLFEGLEEMLVQFQDGSLENMKTLVEYAHNFIEERRNYLSPNSSDLSMLNILNETLESELAKPNLVKEKLMRENIAILYRMLILSDSYSASFRELGIEENGFIGIFHVHDDGSPPSVVDIDENIGSNFPILTISAKQDYKQSGVSIYLIYSGTSHKLYEDLLPKKL